MLWTEKRAKEREDGGESEDEEERAKRRCTPRESVLALETRGGGKREGWSAAAAGCVTDSLVSFHALPRGYASRVQ